MSKVSELVSRGVRVTAGGAADGAGSEVPAEFFESVEIRAIGRFDLPADVAELTAVYDEARVPTPAGGYGADKLVEILESKRLSSLPKDVKVAAVLASLAAAGVTVADVVRDAALRDRALDAFVATKEREAEALRARNQARIAALREECDSFVRERSAEIADLRRTSEAAGSAFAQLQLRKRQEEERLREVLSHFLKDSENPIPAPAKNAKASAPESQGA